MWIVDSTVWVDYFNGRVTPQTDALDAAVGHRDIGLGDIILCEVLQGFRQQADFDVARRTLLRFPVFNMVGAEIALRSAQNYRALRQRGITFRKTVDCLIATFVIDSDFSLLHADRDFDPFEQHLGLRVVKGQ